MKKKANLLLLLGGLIFLPIPDAWGPNEAGNGGVIYCPEKAAPEKVRFLDFWVMKELYEPVDPSMVVEMGTDTQNHIEKVNYVLSRLKQFDPERAERYQKLADEFFDPSQLMWVSGMNLPDLNDTGGVPVPVNCEIKAIALQKKPLTPVERLYTIRKDLFDQLTENEKAGLVLHEITYGETAQLGQKTSAKARYFTAFISSLKMNTLSQSEYGELTHIVFSTPEQLAFKSVEYNYNLQAGQFAVDNLLAMLANMGNGNLEWWIFEDYPAWITIQNQVLVIQPPQEAAGKYSVTLGVKEGNVGAFTKINVFVTPSSVNHPPVWSMDPLDPEAFATTNQPFHTDISKFALDPDGDRLIFAKVSGPSWLQLGPNGMVSGTPNEADVGKNIFRVTVSDGIYSAGVTLLITVVPEPSPKTVKFKQSTFQFDAQSDSFFSLSLDSLLASKGSGQLSWNITPDIPSWLVLGLDGSLMGTPIESDIGQHTFRVSVKDSNDMGAIASVSITVLNSGSNKPPQWSIDPIVLEMCEGEHFAADISPFVSDPDGDTLVLSALTSIEGVAISADGYVMARALPIGSYTIEVRATDSYGAFAIVTVILNVIPCSK